jgi:hypothetical protein
LSTIYLEKLKLVEKKKEARSRKATVEGKVVELLSGPLSKTTRTIGELYHVSLMTTSL